MSELIRETFTGNLGKSIHSTETLLLATGETRHCFADISTKCNSPIWKFEMEKLTPDNKPTNNIEVYDVAMTSDGRGINFSLRTIAIGTFYIQFLCNHTNGYLSCFKCDINVGAC